MYYSMKPLKILSAILVLLLLTSAFSITAFAEDSTTVTVKTPCEVTLQVGEHGKVTVDGTDYSGNTSFRKNAGTVVTYTLSPNTLYQIDKVIYNGTDVTGSLSGNTYTAPALTGNATLSVSFKLIGGGGFTTYTVSFDANGHGTAPGSQTVISGYTATEPPAPIATGYTFGGWYKEAVCTNPFTFSTPITDNITLFAKWTKDGSGGGTETPTTYNLTTSVNGGHGTISAGESNIPAGASRTVTFGAEPGYEIRTVTVNGADVTVTGNSLTLTMNENKTVVVTYQKKSGGGSGTDPHTHIYGSDYKHDPNNHWQECTDGDGAIQNKGPHTFGDWRITQVATETTEGSKERTCSVCGYKETASIPKTPGGNTGGNPGDNTGGNNGGNTGNPKTGDNSNLALWLSLMCLGGIGAGGTVIYSRRRKQQR